MLIIQGRERESHGCTGEENGTATHQVFGLGDKEVEEGERRKGFDHVNHT